MKEKYSLTIRKESSICLHNKPCLGVSLSENELRLLPKRSGKRLWLDPVEFLTVINAGIMALWALSMVNMIRPALVKAHKRGAKTVYPDSLILFIAVIQIAWQMSFEEVIDFFRSRPLLAEWLGFPMNDFNEPRIICVSQYWERRRLLGILPFFFFFVGMVWQLIRVGVIKGKDVVLDGSVLKAWFLKDPDAQWSFPKPWKASTWGFKVHTLLCRWSSLPVMFLVTPANRQESLYAIPLLLMAVFCYGFQILIVRADAGYFVTSILWFIRSVLKAGFIIDYNLRRQGKKKIATLFFINQWRYHLGPRSIIERHFAWAKRYFKLTGCCKGLSATFQHVALTYSVMLAVALAAHRYQRPDLMLSRKGVLAVKMI